jgi:hypothetical protein
VPAWYWYWYWYAKLASRLGLLLVMREGFRRPGDSLTHQNDHSSTMVHHAALPGLLSDHGLARATAMIATPRRPARGR